jgi:dTMP kinase
MIGNDVKLQKNNGKERRGMLVAFEGIDGTGKSTQIRLLAESLRGQGHDVQVTREPTDGPFGQRIRELYASRAEVSKEEELELFLSDRRQHVAEVIGPALAAGRIVLTDRYYLSTAAYQGAVGLDPVEIIRRNEQFAPVPDLVLLLVVPPALGVKRIRTLRGEAPNAFEQEEGLQRVASIFDLLDRGYIRRIDASQSVEEVQRAVYDAVRELLAVRAGVAAARHTA